MTKLSPTSLAALKAGEKISDHEISGLYVEGNRDGSRSFRYLRRMSRKHGGAIIKMTLGKVGDFGLPDAREWAGAINSKLVRGINPIEEANAQAAAAAVNVMTVKEAWTIYMADMGAEIVDGKIAALKAEGNLEPKTAEMKLSRWKTDIERAIGSKALADIEHDDLQAIVDAKFEAGFPSASNHLVVDIKAFFRWCKREGASRTKLRFNPSADLYRRAKIKPRKRCFASWEFRLFVRALAKVPAFDRRFMLLLTLSGVRFQSAMKAHGNEWDHDGNAWTIEKTKNDEAHVVPLAPFGQAFFDCSSWVFPSKRTDQARAGHSTSIVRKVHAEMVKLTDRAIKPWVIHDMRRFVSTFLYSREYEADVVEAVLGHTEGGVKGNYNQWRFVTERRRAHADLENHMIKIALEEGVAEALGFPTMPIAALAA